MEKFGVRKKERKLLTIDEQFVKRLKEYHEHIDILKETHKDDPAGSIPPEELAIQKFVSEGKYIAKLLESILEIANCHDFSKDQFEQEISWAQEQLLINQIVLDKRQKRLCELEVI